MSTLRERKAERTRVAIHKAAMRLFAERGFATTTIADIAAAADVSRATFFSYYASKDDVVFGAAPAALGTLASELDAAPAGGGTTAAVRRWLGGLAGWLDDEDLPLQLRLVQDVPAVAARRLILGRRIEDLIAAHLAREIAVRDPDVAARLAAAAIVSALTVLERVAAERTTTEGRQITPDELEALVTKTMAFVESGLERLEHLERG